MTATERWARGGRRGHPLRGRRRSLQACRPRLRIARPKEDNEHRDRHRADGGCHGEHRASVRPTDVVTANRRRLEQPCPGRVRVLRHPLSPPWPGPDPIPCCGRRCTMELNPCSHQQDPTRCELTVTGDSQCPTHRRRWPALGRMDDHRPTFVLARRPPNSRSPPHPPPSAHFVTFRCAYIYPESHHRSRPGGSTTVKRALITGITGQDGSYLAELLLAKGYEVHGLIRRASTFNTRRIDHLYTDPHDEDARLFLHYADLTDACRLITLLEKIHPDEVYNLAAQSHVKVSFDEPEFTGLTTGMGTTRLLEAIRMVGLDCRYYQASSSEMFGATPPPQNETTPFWPRTPYGAAKVYAYWMTRNYREAYGMFAVNGILFNHESPRRGETFVTRKIARAAARHRPGPPGAPLPRQPRRRRATGATPPSTSRPCGACSRSTNPATTSSPPEPPTPSATSSASPSTTSAWTGTTTSASTPATTAPDRGRRPHRRPHQGPRGARLEGPDPHPRPRPPHGRRRAQPAARERTPRGRPVRHAGPTRCACREPGDRRSTPRSEPGSTPRPTTTGSRSSSNPHRSMRAHFPSPEPPRRTTQPSRRPRCHP